MKSHLSCLFTNICNPTWFHFCFCIIFCLVFFLLFNIIICESFHWLVIVTLYFKIAVCYNETLWIWWIKQWSWNKVICQLYFKQNWFIINNYQCAIHRLNTNLLICLVGAKWSIYKVICISVNFMRLKFSYLRKSICWLDNMNTKHSSGKNCQTKTRVLFTKSSCSYLKNWVSHVLFND